MYLIARTFRNKYKNKQKCIREKVEMMHIGYLLVCSFLNIVVGYAITLSPSVAISSACASESQLTRALAHQTKFGGKMAGEIESVKGHTYIPIEVRTQKARLACVTAGSKEG